MSNEIEEMEKALEAEKERRGKECLEEIQAVLDKHGMMLVGVPAYTNDGRTVANIAIVKKENQNE